MKDQTPVSLLEKYLGEMSPKRKFSDDDWDQEFQHIFEKLFPGTIKIPRFEINRVCLYNPELRVSCFLLRKIENCRYYEPLSEGSLKNPLSRVSVILALPVI